MALAKQMATGSVNINNAMLNVSQYPVPFAGWKQSGVGSRSGGANGIRKYCRAKSIVADRVAMKRELFWYPYTRGGGRFSRWWPGCSGPGTGGAGSGGDQQRQSLCWPAGHFVARC